MTASFVIPPTHPALPGHFPGHPVVPGVVLLDAVLDLLQATHPGRLAAMPVVKFLAPVLPGETIDVDFDTTPQAPDAMRARFTGRRGADAVFEGSFVLTTTVTP